MKTRALIAISAALMSQLWQPTPISESMRTPCYSYPLTNNRRTGKAAERRKAKQRRRARL